jgi:hypothetical protein
MSRAVDWTEVNDVGQLFLDALAEQEREAAAAGR